MSEARDENNISWGQIVVGSILSVGGILLLFLAVDTAVFSTVTASNGDSLVTETELIGSGVAQFMLLTGLGVLLLIAGLIRFPGIRPSVEVDTEADLSRWDWFSILLGLALLVMGPASFFVEGSLLGILFTLAGVIILFRYGRWLVEEKL